MKGIIVSESNDPNPKPNDPKPKKAVGEVSKKAVVWLDDVGWHCNISKGIVTSQDLRHMSRALKLEHRLYLRKLRLSSHVHKEG